MWLDPCAWAVLSVISVLTLEGVVIALPSSAPSPGLALVMPAAPSLPTFPNSPPRPPVCDATIGQPLRSDCDEAITLLPHDPPGHPVLRNFYTKVSDMSDTMPNQLLPFEVAFGSCTVQILIQTEFTNAPHDQASWIELIGPARIIWRECVINKGMGGVLVGNGIHEKLDVIIYGAGSIYSQSEIIHNSPDSVAASIAEIKLLELLGVVQNPYDPSAQSDVTALANLTTNHTTTLAFAKDSTASALVESA